ncbi:MAG: peptidylprolyl isomerase [Rikenellaceae bacterium]
MKVENKKKVAVNYKLTVEGVVADESRPGEPLEFIFGAGMLLPKFEEAILGLEAGEKVAFTLAPADGYGEVNPEAIVELPKSIFEVEGEVPEDMLFEGNHIPMADAQGNRLMGIVKSVGEESVMMDFNHPMAGATLNFEVEVASVRDTTPEDFAPQGGCSCGCGDSDCSCDGDCSNGCH